MVTVRKQVSTVGPERQRREAQVLPYGGDVAVAQSIADVHRDNPWTGRCRACNEPFPCHERRYANTVLVYSGRRSERPELAPAVTAAVGIILGTLLIAAGIIGFMW
jgi:hypothetical protein